MKNKEIADALYMIGEILALKNENTFRIRAYERAARIITSLPQSIEELSSKNKLLDIPGIGEGIAEKIEEYLSTGKINYLEELKSAFPPGLIEIMSLQGMGPKKAQILYKELKIATVQDLAKAAKEGKIHSVEGFGKKTEENILNNIAQHESSKGRILLSEALAVSKEIMLKLSENTSIKKLDAAGSLRRYRETVGDVDILCTIEKGKEGSVMKQFVSLPSVKRVLAHGPVKATVITDDDIQVDLRAIDPASYGAALLYFTGSKGHNVALRTLARHKNMTINEYGIFKLSGKGKPLAAKTEEEMYGALGLDWIAPELREDRGEIEAATAKKLPKLIERKHIKGDTHVHSKYSDGLNSIEEMADKAQSLGYEWVIITDHSRSLKIARGLSVETVRKKLEEIKKLNAKNKKFKILCGVEIDILEHGNLDYPKTTLEELDFVLASIHTGFKQPEEQLTGRVVRALENHYTDCIGHPTGRLINERAPYAINMDKVLEAARDNGKMIEINAFPNRLDLYDYYCKRAKETGVKIAIGTDAHTADHLDNMELGVAVARRGWLEKDDVINTLSYDELMHYLKKSKKAVRTV